MASQWVGSFQFWPLGHKISDRSDQKCDFGHWTHYQQQSNGKSVSDFFQFHFASWVSSLCESVLLEFFLFLGVDLFNFFLLLCLRFVCVLLSFLKSDINNMKLWMVSKYSNRNLPISMQDEENCRNTNLGKCECQMNSRILFAYFPFFAHWMGCAAVIWWYPLAVGRASS